MTNKYLVRTDSVIPKLTPKKYYVIKFDLSYRKDYDFLHEEYVKTTKLDFLKTKPRVIYNYILSFITALTSMDNIDKVIQHFYPSNGIYIRPKDPHELVKKIVTYNEILNIVKTLHSDNKTVQEHRVVILQWMLAVLEIFENIVFAIKITHVELKIFNVRFNSMMKRDCSFLEYHGLSKGRDCPYIGFLDESFDVNQLQDFSTTGGRSYCFFNAHIKTPVEYTIDSSNYFHDFSVIKNRPYSLIKMSVAYSERITTFSDETSETDIVSNEPISGEYIVVANETFPIIVMSYTNISTNRVGIKTIYDIIKPLMFSLNESKNGFNKCIQQNISVELCQNGGTCEVQMSNVANLFAVVNECVSHVNLKREFDA